MTNQTPVFICKGCGYHTNCCTCVYTKKVSNKVEQNKKEIKPIIIPRDILIDQNK